MSTNKNGTKKRRTSAEVRSSVAHARVVALRAELDGLNQTLIEATARRSAVVAELAALGAKGSQRASPGELEALVLKIVQRGPIRGAELVVGLGKSLAHNGTGGGGKGVYSALYRLEAAGRVRRQDPDDRNSKWEIVK